MGRNTMSNRRPLKWNFRCGLGQMATRSASTDHVVAVIGDPFEPGVTRAQQDLLFAVIASRGTWVFRATTSHPLRYDAYMESVAKRSVGAAEHYEKRMKAHFKKYKFKFREGYSLPCPPTPELRVIYDSAAKAEHRPSNPCGTTWRSGFSLGEYHWRHWPLNNVRFV